MNITKKFRKVLTVTFTGAAMLAMLAVALPVSANQDPVGCTSNGVGLSLTTYRNDEITTVSGGDTVQSGETIKYRATLSHLGGTNCNFEGGDLDITTPDGTIIDVDGGVIPLVTSGSDFVSNFASYVVSESNVSGGVLSASAAYSGGESHTGTTHDPASAGVGKNTPYEDTALVVTKTADEASRTAYTWTIDKSVTPSTWNLFDGDSGTSEYTIALTKSAGTSNHSVAGTITIHNPAVFASANITDVTDSITGVGAVSVSCPGGLPQALGPGADLVCTYSSLLLDNTTRTNTATVTTSGDVNGGSDDETIDFAGVVPTEVGGTVNVDDTFAAGDAGPFTDSATYTYTRTFSCAQNEGTHNNTATIVETQQSDSASVTVNCYDLTVTKTAQTTFDRAYQWNVEKVADATEITLATGESYDIHYTVTATKTGQTDSNYAVGGNITIVNSHPSRAADLTGVVDELTGAIGAPVVCPSLTIPAAGQVVCTYSSALPNGDSRTNTATATQQNYSYDKNLVATPAGTTGYAGNAGVTFGDPTNTTDEEVAVTDSYAGALGTVTVAESPKSFNYTRTVLFTDEQCGDQNVDNTATLTTNDTQTVDTADERVLVHVSCLQGCTLTQGYWKTHNDSFGGGAPTDDNWDLITPIAELSGFFTTTSSYPVVGLNDISTPFTWFSVFWTAPKGNAYYNLAHQYMAAKLNVLNGASATPAVDAAIASAEDFFDFYTPASFAALGKKDPLRAQVIGWAGTLGSYNEGTIGPGHCDEQIPV